MRWHHHHRDHRILRKAFWLSSSSSLVWSALGSYVSTVYAGWFWFLYLLLIAGTTFFGICAWTLYEKHQRRRRTVWAVLVYILIFSLTSQLKMDQLWIAVRENAAPTGSLSHWRGPLH